jgi:hypothetical protein
MSTFKSPNGDNSSKRVAGFTILLWVISIGTYYIKSIQDGGRESESTENIIIYAMALAGALLGIGVLDGWFNKKSNNQPQTKKRDETEREFE